VRYRGGVLALVVALVAAPPVALVVHELGHALAAVVLGGREIAVRLIPWGAAVHARFDGAAPRVRAAAFLLAGPLASALCAAALAGAARAGGAAAGALGVVCLLVAAHALLTLAGADGRRAWALAKSRADGER
jgi:hypothetical protein